MPNLVPLNLGDVLRSLGRGIIFYAPGNVNFRGWVPGSGPMVLTHLGDTEGDITIATNAEVVSMTLPEVTGPGRHNAIFTGENPSVSFPLFLADPALQDVITPTGSRHGGNSFRRQAKEYTLAIFPEALFLEEQDDGTFERKTLGYTVGGGWTLGGMALTAEQVALLDTSVWLWRGFFEKPPRRFIGAPEGKNIETVTFAVLHQSAMPEGHQLYTVGDPADVEIDIEGGS